MPNSGDLLGFLQLGGWLMLPLGLASVLALAICIERAVALRSARVLPPNLLTATAGALRDADRARARTLCASSPFGTILIAGLDGTAHGPASVRAAMEEAASAVIHDLERYLTALGTIAAVCPLLGLLGTVIGMIRVFRALLEDRSADIAVLAGGISEALVTTAVGLAVAIPALAFHRHLQRKVEDLTVAMEGQAAQFATFLGAPA